jgi:hypothetical protein
MPKKATITILGILISGAVIILLLFYRAGNSIKYSQDFVRSYPREKFLSERLRMNLNDEHYYLAGADQHNIYLGNDKSKLLVFILDNELDSLKPIEIGIENDDRPLMERPKIQIDSPYFYIKDSQKPDIYKGAMSDWKATKFMNQQMYFDQAVPISEDKIAIQTTVTEEGKTVYKKMLGVVLADSPYTRVNPFALEGQIDEYYSTSGILRFSKKLNQLVYTYQYRNLYQIIDTSLNVIAISHTIDSITKVKIKPIQISQNKLTLASPPAIVNLNAQVFESFLLVHSNLMGNEKRSEFDKASVIDVYSLVTNHYKLSFYIPDFNGSKVQNFIIRKENLIALYDRAIIIYHLNIQKLTNTAHY